MKTYREIPVSERLPKEELIYTVVDEDLNMFQATYDKEFGFIDEFNHTDGITHWLEEFELPNEKDVRDYANTQFLGQDAYAFELGAKFIIDIITENRNVI